MYVKGLFGEEGGGDVCEDASVATTPKSGLGGGVGAVGKVGGGKGGNSVR